VAVPAEVIERERSGAVDLSRDRDLVVRYQQGDIAAFDELYRRYFDRLHAYCARRVGDRHAAEELAQEAFLKALRAMPGFAGDRRFYPWMTVIAQRLCIDHHRRTSRVEPTPEIDPGAVEADHEALFAAVDRDHVTAAFARLAARHREVLELREEREWSYQQIADHLDVPVTTIEALLHRARKALRRQFLAVAGGNAAALPVVGALVARLARARQRLAGHASELAQALIPAAAGVAAVGFVVAPLVGGQGTPRLAPPRVTAQDVAAVAAAPSEPEVVAAAPALAATTPAQNAPAAPPAATPTAAATSPAVDTPALAVYHGDDGVAWAENENDAQPIQFEVGSMAEVGLDPVQLVHDVVTPGKGG
jgi:RNA polymerase sigma-70 factor (ECF subfamily)